MSAKGRKNLVILEEEKQGEWIETTDYFFHRIGDGVPLKHPDSKYESDSLPLQPLAVSEHHGLIFVADHRGFRFAKTHDVIAAAKKMKENGCSTSIQELCIGEIEISDINILSLSANSSTLAVCGVRDLYFFSVDSLLGREKEPFFSCSRTDAESIKDMKWNNTLETSYVILSEKGGLFHGTLPQHLEHVMNDVEAVDWSLKGDMVAIAKENGLTILTSEFIEIIFIKLSFELEGSDGCAFRVDSIRWVRPDSVVVGYIQLSEEGEQTKYYVQVVSSRSGDLSDPSPEPVVIYFGELFSGLTGDVVPYGVGPSMYTSYLEHYEIAITANRNNTDQHIVMLGWSMNGSKNEVAVVDIARDDLLPRVELQEDGDENVILGIYLDKVSLYEKVKVQLEVEQWKELSPCCVLICLTLEGKIVMFHVSSVHVSPLPNVSPVFVEELNATNVSSQQTNTHKLALKPGDEMLKQPPCEETKNIGNIQRKSGVASPVCDASSEKMANNLTQSSLFSTKASEPLSSSSVSSDFLSHESSVTEAPLHNGKLHTSKDTSRLFSQPAPQNLRRGLPKSFDNVQEMVKELDDMLECILEPGGFMDTSTTMQKDSVDAIEQGMGSLSEKCRISLSRLESQLVEIQHLYDGTKQIHTRKAYVGGVLKNAADTQYWDLWNLQKLSSELERKQRHILEMHQQLTSQLAELERHFNAIELDKFGTIPGSTGGRGFHLRSGIPRHVQSLQSLQGIMNLQLDAAEKHAKLLSKQMDLLKIESRHSPPKELKARKGLLENIGLTSVVPSMEKDVGFLGDLSANKILLALESPDVKGQFGGNYSIDGRNREPDSARRRRDSLDKSWIRPNPPKTTIERMGFASNDRPTKPPILPVAWKNMAEAEKFESSLSKHLTMPLSETRPLPETISSSAIAMATQPQSFVSPLPTISRPLSSTAQAQRVTPVSAGLTVSGDSVALATPKIQNWKEGSSINGSSFNNIVEDISYQPTAASSMTATSLKQSEYDTCLPAAVLPSSPSLPVSSFTSFTSSTIPDFLSSTSSSTSVSESVGWEDSNLKMSTALSLSSLLPPPSSSLSSSLGGAEGPIIPVASSSTSSRLDGVKPFPLVTSQVTNESSVSSAIQLSEMQPSSVNPFVSTERKVENLDNAANEEVEMEEEASEAIQLPDLGLGSLGGFGLGAATSTIPSKPNPFGPASFSSVIVPNASSPFSMSVPSGELFRPASLTILPSQASQTSQGFSAGTAFGQPSQIGSGSGFGQPAQIGPGQHALGSVLGSFGQSRQIGAAANTGGFASVSSSGGFAALASGGGGFARLASGGGGFAAFASSGSGFAAFASSGGGFAGNFPGTGGGFGSFVNQGFGGFSAFSGSSGS